MLDRFDPSTTALNLRNALLLAQASQLAYQDADAIRREVSMWGLDRFAYFDRR